MIINTIYETQNLLSL